MKRILLYLVFVLAAGILNAESISLPYLCDFENSVENAKWTLNYNPNLAPGTLKNLWHIGAADASEGKNSMYVSSDGGQTVSYTNSENTILAWRVIELPVGTYDLAFDWLAYGEGSSAIYVAWMDSATKRVLSLTSPDLPKSISDNILKFKEADVEVTGLKNASVWQRATTQIVSDGVTKYKLVFAWNNTSAKAIPPGGAVDNIQIAKASCEKPKNLQVESKGSMATIKWESQADEFILRYKRFTDTQWQTQTGITQDSLVITGLGNGVYDFWLRAICHNAAGNDTGIWVLFPKILVYDALCIDYLKIDSSNCTYGTVANPEQNKGILDFGYATVRSRHTVHFLPGERDPRTNGVLKTIPDGEIASVRLGSWDNAHAETATYEYQVDTSIARVLMLKYAIVFQDPNHPREAQPRVRLQIFDEDGREVNPSCAGADFYAKKNIDGWTTIENGSNVVVWKDWTTLGLNLEDFHGQKIKIKISVFGCTYSAHYAYLYFTLGCTSGKLDGINCGETPTTQFIAPEGFNYRWYKAYDDPKTSDDERAPILCDSIVFDVNPDDTTTYKVDVIYPEDDDCFFTLKANAIPRFPKAQAEYNVEVNYCQSIVKFKSTSYIYTQNRVTGEIGTSEDPIETLYWDFGNGQTSMSETPEVRLPNDGQEHEVMLVAGLCDNLCSDTCYITVKMPILKDTVVEIQEQICEGETYTLIDTVLTTAGQYSRTVKSWGGCDSTIILDLSILDKHFGDIYDTICGEDYFVFAGDTLFNSGVYVDSLKTINGCDSIITLYLEKINPLSVELYSDSLFACANDNSLFVEYDLRQENERTPVSYSILFDDFTKGAGFIDKLDVPFDAETNYFSIEIPNVCRPNNYNATIVLKDENSLCGDLSLPFNFNVYYSSSILAAKFDDLIVVYDADNNGGYSFIEYQWYRNNQLLDGETNSYLYLRDGDIFQEEDCFYLVVKRKDDGFVTRTCEICPQKETAVDDILSEESFVTLTLLDKGSDIEIKNIDKANIYIYTIAGQLLKTHVVTKFDNIVNAPNKSGLYLLKVETQTHTVIYNIQVK